MKIAYFGTPSFSATLLEKLIQDKSLSIEIALVVTQPDKPVGRKMIMTPSPVKVVAQKYGIPVFDNLNIENLDLNKNLKFEISNLDLCLVYAYGFKQLIPLDLLRAPKMQFEIEDEKTSGFVNVHPSMLPRYRGSSPIAYPLLLGENKTGVTLFVMDEKMDHGPIISQEETEITLTDVRMDMEKKLTDLGFEMVKKFLTSVRNNHGCSLHPIQQNHSLASRAPYMTRDDGFIPPLVLKKALNNEPLTLQELPQIIRNYILKCKSQITNSKKQTNPKSQYPKSKQFEHCEIENLKLLGNWNLDLGNSPKIIYDFWRGMHPWPGLWTLVKWEGPKRLKILNMQLVRTGRDLSLQISSLQLEGKSPIDFPTFQKAYNVFE